MVLASLDPRKAESITNQPNYLMTGLTTAILGLISGILSSASPDTSQINLILGLTVVWAIAFVARTVKSAVDEWVKYKSAESTLLDKKLELEYQLRRISTITPKEEGT
jgi:hypothetical protein